MPAAPKVNRLRSRSASLERLGKAANAVCQFDIHLGPISLGTRGISRHRGLKVGAEGGGLGVGFEAQAVLTTGEAGGKAEAFLRHHTKWYALQPVNDPPQAFGHLIQQIDHDYRRLLPRALHVDAPGFYQRMLTEVIEPKLYEWGWADLEVLQNPGYIYGRFRGQASIGGELEVKYGALDEDGFRWYGITAGVALSHDVKVCTAVGFLGAPVNQPRLAEACQIRFGAGPFRMSFVLSKRPLALRHGELDDDLRTIAAALIPTLPQQLAVLPRGFASGRGHVRGVVVLDGLDATAQAFGALETALTGALSGVLEEGCIAVSRIRDAIESEYTNLTFDVFLDDLHDASAVRSALLAEAEYRGARFLLPTLIEALDAAGLSAVHLRIVRLDLFDDVGADRGDEPLVLTL